MADPRRWTTWTAAALVVGCVARPATPVPSASRALDRASLPLEATGPTPRLPGRPATRPLGRPSVDALVAYAAGCDAMAAGDATAAVEHLRLAADLDPARYDVQYALGLALGQAASPGPATVAFTRAADLDADAVEVWTELGRLHLAAHDAAAAVVALRTAMLTTGYGTDPGAAAVVDLLLARGLAADGFDRAALERYAVLLGRFKNPALSVRGHPDLIGLTEHPDALFEPIGRLYDRHGDWATALQAYTAAAAQNPDRFDLQAEMAMDRARLGRAGDAGAADAAVSQAADLVVRDAAAPAAVGLMADVCRVLGRPAVDELRRLSAARPQDRAVRFAAADALAAAGQSDAAVAELNDGWHGSGDLLTARRLAMLYRQQGRTADAAGVIIAASAVNPDAVGGLARAWDGLLRPDQPNRLTAAAVAVLPVRAADEPARQFWLARTWAATDHLKAAAAALDRAVPFPPAARARVDLLAGPSRVGAAERLAATLLPPLAAEVRARALLAAGRPADAVAAGRAGDPSPQAELVAARANHALAGPGRDAAFAAAVGRIAARSPLDEDAYLTLFGYLVDPDVKALEQALQLLNTWRANDPDSLTARLLQVRADHQFGGDGDDGAIDALLRTDGDDPDVLAAAAAVYGDRRDVLVARLEADRAAHPRSGDVAAELAGAYARSGRRADAVRVVDDARSTAAGDADRLYPLANLYVSLGQPAAAEDVLRQVLAADRSHAGANNDLGFDWADAGRNLDRAEAMIRTAVTAEPDNAAFLDSLGWVLYKRGKFADARPVLERAAGPATAAADPAVLDHLGDTLYGLGRRAEARDAWRRALSALGGGGDQPTLRLRLQQKIRQVAASRSVGVAPPAAAGG